MTNTPTTPLLLSDEHFADLTAGLTDDTGELPVDSPRDDDELLLCSSLEDPGDDPPPDGEALPARDAAGRMGGAMPPRLLWLPEVARAAGLIVTEVAGWRTRGGLWDSWNQALDPEGVLVHATAETANGSEAGGLPGVVWGTPSAPPPVSQIYVGRTGRVYIVSSGVANHAGHGNARAAGLPSLFGNARLLGIEHANNNKAEAWSPLMYTASVKLTAALLRKIGRKPARVLSHKEFSTTGKTDPRGVDMGTYRAAVAKALAPKPASPAFAPAASWPGKPMDVRAMPAKLASTTFSGDMRTVPWPALPQLCRGTGGPGSPAHHDEQIRAAVRWFHDAARELFRTLMIPPAEYDNREAGQGTLAFARLLHMRTGTPWHGCVQGPTWKILGHRKDAW